MTIPSTARKAGPLLGTGAQTAWPFTFKVFAASDIAVTIADSLGVETALVLNTDYSVALNANQDTSPGGTVTYPISGSPLASGSVLSIVGDLDYDQPLDLPSGGNFSPLALENELDRLTMQIQQLKEQVGRAIQVSVTTDSDVSLPAPAASQLIGWDATGTSLENVPIESLATAVGYGTFTSDTFTGDGSTTQFTLSSDPATIGNVVVVVDGLTLTPVTDFTLVSGVVAFVVAPSLGAEIVVRHGEALPSGVANAQDVNYLPAGTGAVATTVQAKLRESVSVKDFGAVGDGITDDTLAIQNGINAASARGSVLFFPAATYKVTDTLQMPLRTHLLGELAAAGTSYSGVFPLSSTISFEPTTQKSLFLATGAIGGATGNNKSWSSISGLQLNGNSVVAGGNSQYALDLPLVIYNTFSNLGIQGFNTGIQINQSQSNRFENVKIVGCTEQCVLYGTNPVTATSDVWEQCVFRNSPIGIQTTGPSLGIRFNNCLFEALYTWGVNLVKESRMWMFTNCYTEAVPSSIASGGTTTGNEAMFRVGYDGTTMVNDMNLIVVGGTFVGRSDTPRGFFLDCDYAGGAQLMGIMAAFYTNIIRATANTRNNSLILLGIQFNQSTFETGLTGKYQGFYPSTGLSLSPSQDFLCRIVTTTNRFVGPQLRLNGATATAGAGEVALGTTTATTVGAAGAGAALPATPSGYWQIDIEGTKYKVPYYAN